MSARELSFIHTKEQMVEQLYVWNPFGRDPIDNFSFKNHEQIHMGEPPPFYNHYDRNFS